jgi:nuclear cap-binding protein subunit 1
MDVESLTIFTKWFAHHLSNFDYKWLWEQWKNIQNKEQNNFISEVLSNCIRLSYYARIEQITPHELHHLLPEKKEPHPPWERDDDDNDDSTRISLVSKKLLSKMQKKDPVDVVIQWLDGDSQEEDNTHTIVKDLSSNERVNIIINCLLIVGKKSFSHLLSSLERYEDFIPKYIINKEARLQALKSLIQCWETSPQQIIICADKFQTYQIVTPITIVEWFFSPSSRKLYTKQWPWELLYATFDKLVSTHRRLHHQLKEIENPNQRPNATQTDIDHFRELESKLATSMKEQKDNFLFFFQRFEVILRESLIKFKDQNTEDDLSNEQWLKITLGHLKAFGRKYYKQLRGLYGTLDILFSNTEPTISDFWKQVKSILIHF